MVVKVEDGDCSLPLHTWLDLAKLVDGSLPSRICLDLAIDVGGCFPLNTWLDLARLVGSSLP